MPPSTKRPRIPRSPLSKSVWLEVAGRFGKMEEVLAAMTKEMHEVQKTLAVSRRDSRGMGKTDGAGNSRYRDLHGLHHSRLLSGWVCKRLYCRRCDQECNDCTMRVLENLVSQGYWVTVKPKEED